MLFVTRLATPPFRDRGAVAIIYAFVVVLAIGILGLVADMGRAMADRRDAQKAADLAALAGGQDLPNNSAATTTVATYLQANGWPATSGAALTDGNLENGEVTFSNSNKRMQVRTPKQTTTYFFGPTAAALLGNSSASGIDIGARATVEIRSGLGVLPFVVGLSVAPGEACLTDPPPGAESECPGPDAGNFGSAKVGRADGTGTSLLLARNIKYGLDHNPSTFEAPSAFYPPPPPADTALPNVDPAVFPIGEICKKTPTIVPSGAIFDVSPWTSPFNCIPTDPGLVGFDDGLITFDETKADKCDGRIGGASTGDKVSGCFLTENRYESYKLGSSVDISILDDPRFGFVPRVWKDFNTTDDPPGGGTKEYAVIGFYGAYITDLYVKDGSGVELCSGTVCGTKKPVIIKAELFDLNRLSQEVYPNAGPTGDYVGYGPKIAVLVE